MKIGKIWAVAAMFTIVYGQGVNADQPRADALNKIGEMYHFGRGMPQDYQKAMTYYTHAYGYGSAQAANHLGRLYLNGEGVEKK